MYLTRIYFISSLVALMFTCQATAVANNHYLPLKTDPLIELELERLATLANMPVMEKPYHLATVQNYLSKIKNDYPELYRRINSYIARYRSSANINYLGLEVAYSDFDDKHLPNQRGRTTASNIKGEIAGYWRISDNFNLSLGGTIFDGSGEFIPNQTYLSYYNDYFQIDLGYKEIWLSPLQESAMQLSTNAKPIARFSLSSPVPLTDYNFEYDIAFGKLEKMQGILFDGERSSGRPGFLSVHIGAQFFDWWTIGANRTMVFGGGNRSVNLSDVWQAFIDPVNSDNCGGSSDLQNCNNEFGNQQASISSKFDFTWGIPLQLYFEHAGEDTNNFKAYKLGNQATSIGLFIPYLTDSSSLLVELQYIENAWYTHHLYEEGYRNDLNSIGHWWGDEKLVGDGIGARIGTFRYTYELNDSWHLDAKFATYRNDNLSNEGHFDETKYQRGNDFTIGLNQIGRNDIWRYELYTGNDMFGENFTRISVKYSWQ